MKPEKWSGFQPVGYSLAHIALKLPLSKSDVDDTQLLPTTIGDVYGELADKKLTDACLFGWGLDSKLVTTDGIKLLIKGQVFNRCLLEMMLKFRQDGINPFELVLYYYDRAYCIDDPNESFSFFAVHKQKIVQERLTFFDHYDSGFDPSVFKSSDDSGPWSDQAEWGEAEAKFWYRKFYSETVVGQLMTLRNYSAPAPTLIRRFGRLHRL
jgi:hypothetical protein